MISAEQAREVEVLLVEDDYEMAELMELNLAAAGYKTSFRAETVEQAKDFCTNLPKDIGIVLLDENLHGQKSSETLLPLIRQSYPHVLIVGTSAGGPIPGIDHHLHKYEVGRVGEIFVRHTRNTNLY